MTVALMNTSRKYIADPQIFGLLDELTKPNGDLLRLRLQCEPEPVGTAAVGAGGKGGGVQLTRRSLAMGLQFPIGHCSVWAHLRLLRRALQLIAFAQYIANDVIMPRLLAGAVFVECPLAI